MAFGTIYTFGAIIPFATSVGISAGAAAWLLSVVGGASIFGRLLLTSFARPLWSIRLLKISFAMLPAAFAIWFFASDRYAQIVVFAVILGIGYGGFVALQGDVTPHLFGVAGIGSVLGRLFFCYGIGSMIGPIAMFFLLESSGGTLLPIALAGAVALAGVVVIWGLTPDPVLLEPATPAPLRRSPAQLSPPSVWMPVPAGSAGRGT